MGWYYEQVAIAFLIWALFWTVLIYTGRVRFTLKVLFVTVTGFAVMAALAGDFVRTWKLLQGR